MGKLIFLNTQPISSDPWSPALGYWRACVERWIETIHLCSVYKASLVCLLMCPFTFTIYSIHAVLNPQIIYEGVPKMNPLSVQTVAFIPRTASGKVFKSLLMSGWIIKICWSFFSVKTCSLWMAFSLGREISVQELIKSDWSPDGQRLFCFTNVVIFLPFQIHIFRCKTQTPPTQQHFL